jgi:hypothetical protein
VLVLQIPRVLRLVEARRSIANHPELYPPLHFAATGLLELKSSEKLEFLAIFGGNAGAQS